MALKKSERKEKMIEIYGMLQLDSADKKQLKEIRDKVAGFLGEDTGLFIFSEPIVHRKAT